MSNLEVKSSALLFLYIALCKYHGTKNVLKHSVNLHLSLKFSYNTLKKSRNILIHDDGQGM